MKRQVLSEVGKGASAEDVLEHLFGDDDRTSDYVVYKYDHNKRTLLYRLNLIWVWPLCSVTLPFQWLITGNFGVSRNSKIGRVVDRLVKFD
jgi:hypothetical protein